MVLDKDVQRALQQIHAAAHHTLTVYDGENPEPSVQTAIDLKLATWVAGGAWQYSDGIRLTPEGMRAVGVVPTTSGFSRFREQAAHLLAAVRRVMG